MPPSGQNPGDHLAPDVQPVSEPCELPRPVAWPTQPLRARGQPSSHPLFRRMNGAVAPCFPAISRHSRPRPTSSPRPAEPWGTGPCSLPPASQHAPTPQHGPPCRGFWARRAGSPTRPEWAWQAGSPAPRARHRQDPLLQEDATLCPRGAGHSPAGPDPNLRSTSDTCARRRPHAGGLSRPHLRVAHGTGSQGVFE